MKRMRLVIGYQGALNVGFPAYFEKVAIADFSAPIEETQQERLATRIPERDSSYSDVFISVD
jgi:hypothetical protein